MRVATLGVLVVAAFLAAQRLTGRPEQAIQQPEPSEGELSVAEAIARYTDRRLAVTGYVFLGPGARELRLCNGRIDDDPPRCYGPFVSLYGVDAGSFALRRGESPEGSVHYSPEPVTVAGVVTGTAMQVDAVLRPG